MASGTPSSVRQMSVTAATFLLVKVKLSRASVARWINSCIASHADASSTVLPTSRTHNDGARHCVQDKPRFVHRHEIHKSYAIREIVQFVRAHLNGQAGFATPAGTAQRHYTMLSDEFPHRFPLLPASDERSELDR